MSVIEIQQAVDVAKGMKLSSKRIASNSGLCDEYKTEDSNDTGLPGISAYMCSTHPPWCLTPKRTRIDYESNEALAIVTGTSNW